MSQFVITGGAQLKGSIRVGGSKNAALPLLAATLLTKDSMTLRNVPVIQDVNRLMEIMRSMGVSVSREGQVVVVSPEAIDSDGMSRELVGTLRGSVLLMGALLGRERQVSLPRPGGDVIGARPIDVHLDGFEQLGATVSRDAEVVVVDGRGMKAGEVVLREFSVTATENMMMVAASLPGRTTINIAATEPHVVALGELLELMGAKVEGLGTHRITIEGSESLRGVEYSVIPDMLEAGFFILLGAATRSHLVIEDVPVDDLALFFKKLDDIGVGYMIDGTTVRVQPAELRSFKVQTMPQPGIATDLQAPFAVLATQAGGASLIHDPMYESRFGHCHELIKMGAAVTVCDPHRVIVEGPTPLRGSMISSLDIRSGATLIMAALLAKGTTTINDAEIIDRGYEQLDERLRAIGANISREEMTRTTASNPQGAAEISA